jgi:hypothetical protein
MSSLQAELTAECTETAEKRNNKKKVGLLEEFSGLGRSSMKQAESHAHYSAK